MSNNEDSTARSSIRTALVCRGTGCVAGGSDEIYNALRREVESAGLKNVKVDFVGCHGFCQRGPIVDIEPEGFFYTEVQLEDIPDIVHSHLLLPDIYCAIVKTFCFTMKFKHVITLHNTILSHNKFLIRTIFRKSTFVKCSPAIKDIGSIKKESTIANGINTDNFIPNVKNKFDLRSELNIYQSSI